MISGAQQYAKDVLSGNIVASKWVIKACSRFTEDLKRKDIYFDRDRAEQVTGFFEEILNHWEGPLSGTPIKLAGFQKFILQNLHGWRKDGKLRYNTAYLQMARKQAKTILVAGYGLFEMFCGEENTPQIFIGANNEDQAKICSNAMGKLCMVSPELKRRLKHKIFLHSREERTYAITYKEEERYSQARAMSKDFLTKDGYNPSITIIDEYHAAPSDALKNVAESGNVQRANPRTIVITTPGYNKTGVCYQKDRHISIQVLEGAIEDDSHFVFMAEPDDEDDWEQEKEWIKGNPLCYHPEYNYGENLSELMLDNLRQKYKKAMNEGGSKIVDFKIRNLGLWVDSDIMWVSMETFKKCHNAKHNIKDLEGAECYGGLDLSSDNDLTAFAKFFPNAYGENKHAAVIRSWVPEETINRKADYFKFEQEGWLTRTEGNILHSSRIFKEVQEEVEGPGFQYLCYDRFLSTSIDQLADEGIQCVKMGQGYLSMNASMREVYRMLMKGEIEHFGNMLLGWCVANVSVSTDAAGNIKPDKSKSFEKIDAVVALIMAVNAWMIRNEIKPSVSTEILIGN